MKNAMKLAGIITLLAVIGFFATSCSEDEIEPVFIEMVQIPGGTFRMGSPWAETNRNRPNEEDYRTTNDGNVTVSGFYISKYQITQGQYKDIMGINPAYHKGNTNRPKGNTNLPVERVSWYDAIEFCNALSIKEGLTPFYNIDKEQEDPNNFNKTDTLKWHITTNISANGYRLPTEAQWEYACRAGTTTAFYVGNSISTVDQANFRGIGYLPEGRFRGFTTPVGTFYPNHWGLYDMHGNVWEWCWDWWHTDSVPSNTVSYDYAGGSNNPLGAVAGEYRIARGGSWNYDRMSVRSARRLNVTPSSSGNVIGFRVVLPL